MRLNAFAVQDPGENQGLPSFLKIKQRNAL